MSYKKLIEKVKKLLSKENAVKALVPVGLIGIVLICLPDMLPKKETQPIRQVNEETQSYEEYLQNELSRIVSAITGEEAPVVLVTVAGENRYVFAEDESANTRRDEDSLSEETEKRHVILKDNSGAQQPLAVTEMRPDIKGVVVVSTRAGEPYTREKITNAVKTALDISSARVCVIDSG